MNTEGESCFPSTKTIAVKCSLTERTVCTHLELAHKNGWIEKNQCALGGREWRRNEYKATIPDKVLKEVQHLMTEGTEPDAEGTEPDDNKALKEVQSRRSVEDVNRGEETQVFDFEGTKKYLKKKAARAGTNR
jgi:hypothetical protein